MCHGPPGTGKTFTLAAAAIEHAARGEAVLVVCRSPKASDVMAKAVERLAGTDLLTLRTGSKQAVGKLRDHIDLLLSRAYENDGAARKSDLKRATKILGKEVREFEGQLAAAMRSGKWFDPEGEPRWWHLLGQWWDRPGESTPLLMEVAKRLVELQRERMREAKEHLAEVHARRLEELLREQWTRGVLKKYRMALKRKASGAWEKELAAIDAGTLLSIFPIWIVESDDVHRVLPLQEGLFPLVVMDEASQCDLASAIPALHRGKRALIAGDPKQLRTVSFLPNHRLVDLCERHAISEKDRVRFHFRDVSLIDAAMDASDAVHFLCEHFRSRPELIAFSNDTFYRSKLRLMRELPSEEPTAVAAVLQHVEGSRDASGVNRRELEQVAAFLREWYGEQQRAGTKGSIGFLSPFRAQVDAFENVVSEIIGRETLASLVSDHELVAATAHGFQGDERDVMVLSLAVCDDCPAATRRFLEREDVFNVSITRARDRVVVFHSVTRDRLPGDSLLAGWLASLERDHRLAVEDPACRWVTEVGDRLRKEGWSCESGRSVGGIAVDLLVDGGGKRLAIDVVGQRGRAGERVGLREQLLLQRAGLGMVPLGIHEWRTDPERCVEVVRGYLK
ncbi:DEAD/DEAH box helicase [Luteolibacter soli]|uniref:AAA domain-containing protein n=1 Tax=Luteolibacter soli TaxID=3135280 RepID=A0ABU9AR20_9BACT